MSEFKVTGVIEKFLPIESGTSKNGEWKKQSFVVNTGEPYNYLYCFNIFGAEKVENLTKYNKAGDTVTVKFNISCREYDGKYYTDLSAWRIDKEGADQPEVVEAEEVPVGELPKDDNLPF